MCVSTKEDITNRLLDMLDEKRRCFDIVDGDLKEALHGHVVKIECDDLGHTWRRTKSEGKKVNQAAVC